jgi:hypothetical protein
MVWRSVISRQTWPGIPSLRRLSASRRQRARCGRPRAVDDREDGGQWRKKSSWGIGGGFKKRSTSKGGSRSSLQNSSKEAAKRPRAGAWPSAQGFIEAARARGIEEGSDVDRQLAMWLATRPSADFFEQTLRAIGAILQTRPPEEREGSQRDLLSYCTAIASASGGILGFGKVSPEEQKVLERISQAIERTRASGAPAASRPFEGRS